MTCVGGRSGARYRSMSPAVITPGRQMWFAVGPTGGFRTVSAIAAASAPS